MERHMTPQRATTDPGDFLPVPATDLQLLLAVSDEPLHGYGMMKAVEEQSDGKLRVELGSLYRVLQRLERDGLVEEAQPQRDPPSPGRERRYYRITALGRSVVAAELERLRSLIALATGARMRPGKA
jgi:DNA-binding PadR family transcriptional regulator